MVNIYDCIFKWTHIKSSLQICGSVGDLHRVSDMILLLVLSIYDKAHLSVHHELNSTHTHKQTCHNLNIVYLEKVRFIEIYLKRCSQKTCPKRQLFFYDVIFKTYRCDIFSV